MGAMQTDVARPDSSTVMTVRALSDAERRQRLIAYRNASPEVQAATVHAERARVFGDSDPLGGELAAAKATGDTERVAQLSAEREQRLAAHRADVEAADRELHRVRVREAISTATRPVAPRVPHRTTTSGTARPARRPSRRRSARRRAQRRRRPSSRTIASPPRPRPASDRGLRAFRAGGAS